MKVESNIVKCKGEKCIIKEHCFRYTIHNNKSLVIDAPFEIKNGKFTCKLFYGENAQQIFEQLKDIMK